MELIGYRHINDLCDIVNNWAKDHAVDDYLYGSRQSYWAAALASKIITRDEYERGAGFYTNLWTYRGD